MYKYFCAFNAIFSRIGRCTFKEVISSLSSSKCLPYALRQRVRRAIEYMFYKQKLQQYEIVHEHDLHTIL
jgi:hypothetical protein